MMEEKDSVYTMTIDDPKLIETWKYYRKHPEKLLDLPRENMRMYLRGMFDANGLIYINDEGIALIGLWHTQQEKIDGFQQMLKRFEINSVIYHSTSTNFSEPSQLFIVGLDDLLNFWEQIGMENQEKRERFSEAWEVMKKAIKGEERQRMSEIIVPIYINRIKADKIHIIDGNFKRSEIGIFEEYPFKTNPLLNGRFKINDGKLYQQTNNDFNEFKDAEIHLCSKCFRLGSDNG